MQDTMFAWLVDTTAQASHVRFRRGTVLVGLRSAVTIGDLQGSLLAIGAVSATVTAPPSNAANVATIAVPPGSERPAVLALLTDCRVRYAELMSIVPATFP